MLKTYSYVPFPNHPQKSKRKPCGQNLLRKVTLKGGTEKLYSFKVYCYKSIRERLSDTLAGPTIASRCEEWRDRITPEGYLCDIFDGKVWKEFITSGFLSERHNLPLMMNCDWFQPFKHTQYSVGVLYLVIMNLPRNIRFKPENLVIAGIIPGHSEPSCYEINSYLRPLIDELLDLWYDGFSVSVNGTCAKFRAAVLRVALTFLQHVKYVAFLAILLIMHVQNAYSTSLMMLLERKWTILVLPYFLQDHIVNKSKMLY